MTMIILDQEEQELMESVEKEEWQSIPLLTEELKKSKEYARLTLANHRQLNIRLSQKDFTALKAKAIELGIPYQFLISSIIHKYLSGYLVEVEATHHLVTDSYSFVADTSI
jgi:predicted DNA binding CopG/RHH family protein